MLQDRKPSGHHFFGTDDIGRDVMAGIIHGSRYALAIGLVAMSIALTIGIILGLLAGFYGGKIDIAISRLIEIVITFPTFFLIITIVAMVQQGSIWLIMGLIGFTNWTSIARFVRGEVLRVRGLDFITAATALGYSQPRVIFRHVLPNAIAPVLVSLFRYRRRDSHRICSQFSWLRRASYGRYVGFGALPRPFKHRFLVACCLSGNDDIPHCFGV